MKRSVMKQGPSTFVISLPSLWTKKHGIKKGDLLDINEHNNSLVIGPKREAVSSSITLDVSGTLPMTKRIAGALYKTGYDDITLHYSSFAELEQIRACFQEVVGLEIIENTKGRVVIKKLAALDAEEFDTLLKKQFHILKTMADESLQAVLNRDKELLQEVIARDTTFGKFSDFCRRQLIQQGWVNAHRTPAVYYIVEQLEKIADVYKHICRDALKESVGFGKETIALYTEVNGFVNQVYLLYYDFDLKKMTVFGKKGEELKRKINERMKLSLKDDRWVVNRLAIITDLTFDLNGSLMVAFVQ